MNKINRIIFIIYFQLFTAVSTQIVLASNSPLRVEIHNPVSTPFGIVFTNQMGTSLYLTNDGITKELFSSPGCGIYYMLSPDKSIIGFKEILDNGTQVSALLDLSTGEITLLNSPVSQCGQVSFDSNGDIAFSVGNDIHVMTNPLGNNRKIKIIPIETYTNITAISSDGSSIAYSDSKGYIYILDIQSQKRIRISNPGCMVPLWSPAGVKLCYSSLNGKLFVFDSQTKETYALGNGIDPVWMQDGLSLVTVRQEIQQDNLINSDLYQISYNGKESIQLTNTKDIFETEPSIGINGNVIYRAYNNDKLYEAAVYQKTLKVSAAIEINSGNIIKQRNVKETSIQSEADVPPAHIKIPSAVQTIEMPYVNQVYDTPPGFGNLGSSACGPTSAIMVIAYYNLLPPWNLQVYYPTKHTNGYGNYVLGQYQFNGQVFPSGGYGFMWYTSSDPYHSMTFYYREHRLAASELDAPSLDTVISEVSAGYPYTLCNGLTSAGHIIVIIGAGNQVGTVVCNDPYGNKNSGSYPSYNGKDVKYDWPGYNNGHENLNNSWWGVSVRYHAPVWSDSTVDDLQFSSGSFGCDGFSLKNTPPASMSLWQDKTTGDNNHEWYTYTKQSDTCIAEWRPVLTKAGNYEVLAYIFFNNPRNLLKIDTEANYRIYYSGDSTNVKVDQSNYITGSWVSLGTYQFEKGDSGYVELGDGAKTPGQVMIVDAITWRYRSPLLVQNNPSSIPTHMILEQNYPNPFNPTTNINYSITNSGIVSLKVYNVLGQEVAILVSKNLSTGNYSTTFNASNLPSGIYIYKLTEGSEIISKKMMVLK